MKNDSNPIIRSQEVTIDMHICAALSPPDCALLAGELASKLLAAQREQNLQELAAEIAPDWNLPTEAVQSGLETLRSHLELVQGDAALLYEMI